MPNPGLWEKFDMKMSLEDDLMLLIDGGGRRRRGPCPFSKHHEAAANKETPSGSGRSVDSQALIISHTLTHSLTQ
jgi:hypothetical protein